MSDALHYTVPKPSGLGLALMLAPLISIASCFTTCAASCKSSEAKEAAVTDCIARSGIYARNACKDRTSLASEFYGAVAGIAGVSTIIFGMATLGKIGLRKVTRGIDLGGD